MPFADLVKRTEYLKQYRLNCRPNIQRLKEAKNKPCMDCGGTFPSCAMQFDHREPSDKKFEIGRNIYMPWASLEKEMAKCDLVCANCHAVRTHSRKEN